jgi:hypothetical protein
VKSIQFEIDAEAHKMIHDLIGNFPLQKPSSLWIDEKVTIVDHTMNLKYETSLAKMKFISAYTESTAPHLKRQLEYAYETAQTVKKLDMIIDSLTGGEILMLVERLKERGYDKNEG